MNYRVLLVGLGRIGWRGFPNNPTAETHYASVDAHPRLELAGAVDSDAATRLEFQSATHRLVYEDIDAALADCQPQIVIVATPAPTHNALVHKAAFADSVRGIICEKPMAPTLDECSNMAVTCYRRNKVLLVGHQRRYEQSHRMLRAFLKSEALGEPLGGRCVFPGDEWLNNGSHAADTMRFLLGDALPFTIRLGGENTRLFTVTIACRYGTVQLESYNRLVPGYRQTMYDDLIECMESEKRPECSADDGLAAVRLVLQHEELWKQHEAA